MRALVIFLILAITPVLNATSFAQSALATDEGVSDFEAQIELAMEAIMVSPPEALERATLAEELALGNEERLATAKWLKGEALSRMHRLDEARIETDNALELVMLNAAGGKLNADILRTLAGIAMVEGDYELALKSLFNAHDIYARIEEPRSQAIVLQQTGSVYIDAGQFDKAIDYYNRAGAIWSDDIALDLARLNNVASAQIELGQYDDAVTDLKDALLIAEAIEAEQLQAQIWTSIADALIQDESYSDAADALVKARALSASEEGQDWVPFIDGVAARLAVSQGQYSEARPLIEGTFAGIPLTETDMFFTDFHELAYKIFSEVGETETALAHLAAFKRLDDEARNIAASANTALLSAEFDFATQELEIANLKAETLEQEVAIQQAKSRQRLLVFRSVGTITAVILIGLIISYLSIRRSRNLVRAANQELSSTNTALEKALKAKSEFLATTSHEIRTPLNGILGMTEILLRGGKLEESTLDRVQAIHGSSQTMKAIVDDILDVSKMENGEVTITPQEFALHPLLSDIERIWRDSASNKSLGLTLEVHDIPERIISDPQRLRQIGFNLASNAVKFTDQGEVTISCSIEEAGEVSWLVLEVTDTGIGIPSSELERIFEPFHQVDGGTTRAQGGTGLGLTICRNFARAMNGDISVQSREDEGSTFTLRIPVELPETETASETSIVLAIEPNPMKQHILSALFKNRDECLECVSHFDEATAWCNSRTPNKLIAQLSVLGNDMPSAVKSLVQLRKHASSSEIILFNDTDWAQSPLLKLSGAQVVLDGPLNPAALLTTLQDESGVTTVKSA